MSDKWYSKLITSVRDIHSDRIIVSDPDRLGEAEEIREELAADFVLHTYGSEVALRSFIGKNAGKRMVIFNPPGVDYIPYDIDSASGHAAWQLKEVFPGLHADTLRNFPSAYYQKIYDKYRINVPFLKKKMAEAMGERDVTVRAVGSFIKTLGYFGVTEENGGKTILKNKLPVNEEQMRIIIQLYASDIIRAPQVSFHQFTSPLFNYFNLPDLHALARKYSGIHWDHQHRVKEDYLSM